MTENLTAALVMTGNNFSLILTEDFDSCAGSPISLTTVYHYLSHVTFRCKYLNLVYMSRGI